MHHALRAMLRTFEGQKPWQVEPGGPVVPVVADFIVRCGKPVVDENGSTVDCVHGERGPLWPQVAARMLLHAQREHGHPTDILPCQIRIWKDGDPPEGEVRFLATVTVLSEWTRGEEPRKVETCERCGRSVGKTNIGRHAIACARVAAREAARPNRAPCSRCGMVVGHGRMSQHEAKHARQDAARQAWAAKREAARAEKRPRRRRAYGRAVPPSRINRIPCPDCGKAVVEAWMREHRAGEVCAAEARRRDVATVQTRVRTDRLALDALVARPLP